MSNINTEAINEALTCGICQDIVTLPVHANCCEKAKSMNPLNKLKKKKPKKQKSDKGKEGK